MVGRSGLPGRNPGRAEASEGFWKLGGPGNPQRLKRGREGIYLAEKRGQGHRKGQWLFHTHKGTQSHNVHTHSPSAWLSGSKPTHNGASLAEEEQLSPTRQGECGAATDRTRPQLYRAGGGWVFKRGRLLRAPGGPAPLLASGGATLPPPVSLSSQDWGRKGISQARWSQIMPGDPLFPTRPIHRKGGPALESRPAAAASPSP